MVKVVSKSKPIVRRVAKRGDRAFIGASVTPEQKEFARRLGGGNIATGIERALTCAAESSSDSGSMICD